MTQSTRHTLYIYGLLLLLLLLISGLPSLVLSPGSGSNVSSLSNSRDLTELLYRIAMILLPIISALFILFLAPILGSRRLWLALGGLLLLFLSILWLEAWLIDQPLPDLFTSRSQTAQSEVATPQAEPEGAADEALPEALAPPLTPNWFGVFVNIMATLVLLALAGVASWYFWPRQQQLSALLQLSQEVEEATAELASGGDLRNVVLRCYTEMTRIVGDIRGVHRPQGMTPREFELALTQLGLPEEPVVALTRLFEDVRYGTSEPDATAEERAVVCLTAVSQACREAS